MHTACEPGAKLVTQGRQEPPGQLQRNSGLRFRGLGLVRTSRDPQRMQDTAAPQDLRWCGPIERGQSITVDRRGAAHCSMGQPTTQIDMRTTGCSYRPANPGLFAGARRDAGSQRSTELISHRKQEHRTHSLDASACDRALSPGRAAAADEPTTPPEFESLQMCVFWFDAKRIKHVCRASCVI